MRWPGYRGTRKSYVAEDPLIPCRNSTFGPSSGPSTATSNPTPSLSMRMAAILRAGPARSVTPTLRR